MPVSAGESKELPCPLCNGSIFRPALNCEGFSFVRCKRCGLVQRNPQPLKEEIVARYKNTFGNDYLSYELENEKAFLNLQLLALKDAGFKFDTKGKSVLDIGCATGSLLAHLREYGWNVTGVEISPCAGYARDKRKLNVRDIPLEENNFPSGSFEVILASHLIEHLNDPKTFLIETKRILKDNGDIYITTPNISGFQAHLYGSDWRSAIFDHLYLFSRKTLSKMLKNTGFKVESCRTWGGIAAGMAPKWLKKNADFLAKRFNCGDVMIIKAKKESVD